MDWGDSDEELKERVGKAYINKKVLIMPTSQAALTT
jgi:hypothetical protein